MNNIFKILDKLFPFVLCLLIEEYFREYSFINEFKMEYENRRIKYYSIFFDNDCISFRCYGPDRGIFVNTYLVEEYFKNRNRNKTQRQITFYNEGNETETYGEYNMDPDTKKWRYIVHDCLF